MVRDGNRKDLTLTRVAIERATQQERLSYGALVEQLRKGRGFTQGQLEERSGVTSRTIRNIESGAVAGQADKLIRLFIALEVDLDGEERAEVEPHLAVIAPLLRSIHPDYRLNAVTAIIPTLTEAMREHPAGAVDDLAARRNVRRSRQDLESAPLDSTTLAASTDNTPIDPERGGA